MSWIILLIISIFTSTTNGIKLVTPWIDDEQIKNDAPIIGVLAQEISWKLEQEWPDTYNSYIAASYIKFVEGGGARAVPVWIGKSKRYYEFMLSRLNGILFPGGGTFFNQSKGYAEAGEHIYNIAKQINDNGIYFPLFGTCLGFEFLLYASNDYRECRVFCSAQRQSLPLEFTEEFQQSRIFGSAPTQVVDILRTEQVTANFHSFCITKQNMTYFDLDVQWRTLSYNKDKNGLEFVSTIEHKTYPFYGVQFHPEKSLYEWIRNRNIAHTDEAITAAQYFASFFVNECRKNSNHFSSASDENRYLIYNFPATFTGLINSTFEQSYLFKHNTTYPKSNEFIEFKFELL